MVSLRHHQRARRSGLSAIRRPRTIHTEVPDMHQTMKRAILSVIVFAVVYFLFDLLLKSNTYDVYLDGLRISTAVLGAGCYWIGSRE